LKKIRPDIPVVLLTAYAEDEARLSSVREQLAGFVAKPFAYEELILAVRAAINGEKDERLEPKSNRTEFLRSADRGKAS